MAKQVTASFTERLSLQDKSGNWGTQEASITLSDEFPESFDDSSMEAETQHLGNRCREQVWSSLGITFNLNDDGYLVKSNQEGVRPESSNNKSSAASRPAAKSTRAQAPANKAAARGGSNSAKHLDSDGFTTDGKQWIWDQAFVTGCPEDDWYINTHEKAAGTKSENHPDLKLKQGGHAVWSNKAPLAVNGKDGVYTFKSGDDALEAILAGGEGGEIDDFLA